MKHQRTYRNLIKRSALKPFNVVVKETDLFIHSKINLKTEATEMVLRFRSQIETYCKQNPLFLNSLKPLNIQGPFPKIIHNMVNAGKIGEVGPFASVAGAIAQAVGEELLAYTDEIIVENGGDIFIKSNNPINVGIYAGNSPLNLKLGLMINSADPISVCTSSGTVGHSLSLGTADAVCVVSASCAIADAVATSLGNRIHSNTDIQPAIEYGKIMKGIDGIVIIRKSAVGMWGNIEITELKGTNKGNNT